MEYSNQQRCILIAPNLLTNTLYDVQIATVCGTTYSPYSNTVNFTTGTGCLTPTGMNVTNLTSTSAKLNWNASTGAIYYGIRYRKTSVTTWTTSTSTGTSKTLGTLVAATPYEFHVQTVCSATSSSAWSASTAFTTAAAKPGSATIE